MGLRAAAFVTVALLIAYHLMRVAATACSGSACDAFIPLSVLLPVLVLIAASVTGGLAISASKGRLGWLVVLSVCTVLGVIGPLVALAVLRDSPDAFVVTSTILVALVPASALVYSFSAT